MFLWFKKYGRTFYKFYITIPFSLFFNIFLFLIYRTSDAKSSPVPVQEIVTQEPQAEIIPEIPQEEAHQPIQQPSEPPPEEAIQPIQQPSEPPPEEPIQPIQQPSEPPPEEAIQPIQQPSEPPPEEAIQPIQQPSELHIKLSKSGLKNIRLKMIWNLTPKQVFVYWRNNF